MTTVDDRELVVSLQAGDVEAFNAIYWRYHRALYANLVRLVKDGTKAEDILQEVFITLWEKRSTLHPDLPVANWLFSVSFYTATAFLKRQLKEQVARQHLTVLFSQDADDNAATPLPPFEALQEAVQHLSPKKRKAFELCKLQGKTYQEAAAEMNISRYTVKEYLAFAVAEIRKHVSANSEVAGLAIVALAASLLRCL